MKIYISEKLYKYIKNTNSDLLTYFDDDTSGSLYGWNTTENEQNRITATIKDNEIIYHMTNEYPSGHYIIQE